MGFKTLLDELIVRDLAFRAQTFAASYDPVLPTLILVPGGMGSRLYKTLEAYDPARPFPQPVKVQKLWLSFGAVLQGDLAGLRLTRQEHDRGDRPVLARGEVSSSLFKKYDDTKDFFVGPNAEIPANYVVFGYDWRRLPAYGAAYLRLFLEMLRNEAAALGHPDPRPRTTLLGHSQGGLVIKQFLNDLAVDGEAPGDWFERFVSVGTPFYGTHTHLSRYYEGIGLLNLLSPGGKGLITDLVWTLPGPYVLLPAPVNVLGPRLGALRLERYPVTDDDTTQNAADAFDPAQRDRFPGFMTRQQNENDVFTDNKLFDAAKALEEIDRKLPADFEERTFHVRSTLRQDPTPQPLMIFWRNVDGASVDGDPVDWNGGDTDGTVPLWSARLATTPDNHVFDFRGIRHAGMAEHADVLRAVADLMRQDPVRVPAQSEDLPIATANEIESLAMEIAEGRADASELETSAPRMRRFEEMTAIHR